MDGKAGVYFFIWINGITDSIQKRYINQTEILSVRPLQKHSSMTLDRHFLTVFFREDGLERFFGIDKPPIHLLVRVICKEQYSVQVYGHGIGV